MDTKTYNNQTMIAYLLGSLPETEAEAFDELSFADDEFADELNAAEKDLVDAFINGELSGEKLKQFKNYYLVSPRRREKVEFAKAFQSFAEKQLAETEKFFIAEAKPKQTWAGFLSDLFTISRPSRQWGFAFAALALVVFGGWLMVENARLRSQMGDEQARRDTILQRESELQQRERQLQDEIANQRTTNAEAEKELANIRAERERLEQELKKEQEQKRLIERREAEPQLADKSKTPISPSRPISIASFILTPALRGNNELKTISIPAQTDLVKMQLELEADDYKSYRVVLHNQSNNQILWRSGQLKSKVKGANNVLTLRFPAKLLKPQVYSLEVYGLNEIISDYSFRVVQ